MKDKKWDFISWVAIACAIFSVALIIRNQTPFEFFEGLVR